MFCHVAEPLLIRSLPTLLPLDSALQSLWVVSFHCSVPLLWDNPKFTVSPAPSLPFVALFLPGLCLLPNLLWYDHKADLPPLLDDPLIHFCCHGSPPHCLCPFLKSLCSLIPLSQAGWDSIPSCNLLAPSWGYCPLLSPSASAELCSSPARGWVSLGRSAEAEASSLAWLPA